MTPLATRWWMRVVGTLYVLLFVMAALVKAPIRVEGPAGVLDRAAAGDALARFTVDTWVTLGLELGAVGVALWIASRAPQQARALIAAVCGMELAGMFADVYKLARGYAPGAPLAWIVIHGVIIGTGLLCLRGSGAPSRLASGDLR